MEKCGLCDNNPCICAEVFSEVADKMGLPNIWRKEKR